MDLSNLISIGIDPSLTGTGVVVLNDGKLVEKRLIKSKKDGDSFVKELQRIQGIVAEIDQMIGEYSPDIVCMEGLAFMARNTSALVQLSALNYFIRAVLNERVPWVIVQPSTLKKFITGSGSGGKDVVMMEVYKRYGVTITDNNLSDAYVLAQIGAASLGRHTRALTVAQKEVITLLSKQA